MYYLPHNDAFTIFQHVNSKVKVLNTHTFYYNSLFNYLCIKETVHKIVCFSVQDSFKNFMIQKFMLLLIFYFLLGLQHYMNSGFSTDS